MQMTPNRADKLVPVAAGYSQAGLQRAVNEDHLATPEGLDSEILARRGRLYIVADGMGGHAAGEQASALTVSTVMEAYYGHPSLDPGQALTDAIRQANAAIYRQAQRAETAGMGSTVVAALVRGHELYIAHVGDSRAYLIRGQTIRQLTRDHSWVAEQVRAGLLSEEEARHHPQRNIVTRSLGSEPEVEIDLSREALSPGDAVLLCSDGLTDQVRDEEIGQIVAGSDPSEAANQLIELASQRGGSDDVTALVIGIRPAPRLAFAGLLKPSRLAPIVGGVAIAMVILISLFWALRLRGPTMPAAIPPLSPTAVAMVSTPTPTPSVPVATPTVTPSVSVPTPTLTAPAELTIPVPQPSSPTITQPTLTAEGLAQSLDESWAVASDNDKRAEEWKEVVGLIEQILAINPNYDDMHEKLYAAHVNYGHQLAAEDRLEEARQEFMRALDIKPGGGEAVAELRVLAGETPVPSATSTPGAQPTIHVVQQGEWLWTIARRYGTTAQAIMTTNGLTSDTIHPGQELRIPIQ